MRIRTIKPEFWQSEDLANVSDKAKLLAIGLLNIADDEGYLKSHQAIIKSQLFPFTEESLNIHGMLIELSNANYLTMLKGSDGKDYVCITNFNKHQKINRPSPSKIKASLEFTEHSLNDHGGLTIGKERKGTGKGKEQGKELTKSTSVDLVKEVFDFWVSQMRKDPSKTKLSDKRKKSIRERLKDGYTVEQIKSAVVGCSLDAFSMGQNDRRKPFNDIELICRTAEKLESFFNQTEVLTPSVSRSTQNALSVIQNVECPYDE